ncbi:hypothetical protein [Micromonospora haikouensis]|uniref:hypothetical protein n=1 Tax=Micromonospora haikouensis TaxID=686309 RepID=UPI0037AF682D
MRFGTKEAAEGWEELVKAAPGNLWRAWESLTYGPEDLNILGRQHRLKGELGSRMVQGVNLEQWQYEVTGGGRIWYCPDAERRIVWVTYASTAHPRATD